MQDNPYSLTFGQIPKEFISRTEQMDEIRETFRGENPSNRVFMISGIRGSGKSVSLAEISDFYSRDDAWIVLNLSADMDIISESVSELLRQIRKRNIFSAQELSVSAKISLPVLEVSFEKTVHSDSSISVLRDLLEGLGKKGKKVLFILDEISGNTYVKQFASQFQIFIRQNYPVYLIMAGLYSNISLLQNVKTLTFLYRAQKIFLEPLSIPAITANYSRVFEIPPEEAVRLARLTKGYSFAFQTLGYLFWRSDRELNEELLRDYDSMLARYVYEKIWDELSEKDREIVKMIAGGTTRVREIREALDISLQLLNVYRRRLIDQGIADGKERGRITLTLPRLEEYIRLYAV